MVLQLNDVWKRFFVFFFLTDTPAWRFGGASGSSGS